MKISKYIFYIAGSVSLIFFILYIILSWDTIEREITKRRLPEARQRYYNEVAKVIDVTNDSFLEKNIVIEPHVPFDEDRANCIMAGDIYVYGSLDNYFDIQKTYEQHFIEMNFKYSHGMSNDEDIVYYDAEEKMLIEISQVEKIRISWNKYITVYQIQFNYAEPSLSCYTEIYLNLK